MTDLPLYEDRRDERHGHPRLDAADRRAGLHLPQRHEAIVDAGRQPLERQVREDGRPVQGVRARHPGRRRLPARHTTPAPASTATSTAASPRRHHLGRPRHEAHVAADPRRPGRPGAGDTWPTAAYLNGDISLADDARFGRIFAVHLTGKSKNPWGASWQQPGSLSAEPHLRRRQPRPQTDAHPRPGRMVRAVGPAARRLDGERFEHRHPVRLPDPRRRRSRSTFDDEGIGLDADSGMLTGDSPPTTNYQRHRWGPWQPIITHWYDFVFGVKTDNDPADTSRPAGTGTGWYNRDPLQRPRRHHVHHPGVEAERRHHPVPQRPSLAESDGQTGLLRRHHRRRPQASGLVGSPRVTCVA